MDCLFTEAFFRRRRADLRQRMRVTMLITVAVLGARTAAADFMLFGNQRDAPKNVANDPPHVQAVPVARGVGEPPAASPALLLSTFRPDGRSTMRSTSVVANANRENTADDTSALSDVAIQTFVAKFLIEPGATNDPVNPLGSDQEERMVHELGHAAIGLGHLTLGAADVEYIGADCCSLSKQATVSDEALAATPDGALESVAAVPEPSSFWLLLGPGAGATAVWCWNRFVRGPSQRDGRA